ncbi:MAG: hypothetical protein JST61_02600 [Acidobacteria bacterium]|nr:hypothetical protein [Acidobacteriota bacterium]
MPDRRTFLKQSALAATLLSTRGWSASPNLHIDDALPGEYFRRMAKWCAFLQASLDKNPTASLSDLEAQKGWYHFPYTVLSAAVLYAKQHRTNPHFHDARTLRLALQIGDIAAKADRQGTFSPRLDSYRDTYMWVEAYALLRPQLGEERNRQWRASLERNIELLVPELVAWVDIPAYTENFIGTSPNHFAWWAATVLVGGVHLEKKDWIDIAGRVLKRFATTEQNPDGYWGEHNPNGPTGGYNYLTTLAVGVYWEHTKDPAALRALRRATDFHGHLTYPDGNLVELFNDRNRYWHVSPWGQFAFSNFSDGRGYAELLTHNLDDETVDLDTLGLLGQNALYYHDGPVVAPPPAEPAYFYRLHAEGGVRKQGPWVTGLAGIVDTPLPRSQWFLDRQADLSLFHAKTGLIISGAHSKHQPELATFSEKLNGEWFMKPKGSRLVQSPSQDVLAVAHNTFSAEIVIPTPSKEQVNIDIRLDGRGPVPEEAWLALQLMLKPGAVLQTGTGRRLVLSGDRIELKTGDLAGSITHNGWTLTFDNDATLQWPVYPYNPYRNGNETKLDYAIGLLRMPLHLKTDPQKWLQLNERIIHLGVRVPDSSSSS